MCLLIVGNPGSFSAKMSSYLSKDYKLELLEINKSIDLSQNILAVKNKLKNKIYKFLIYLGGETRNEKLMKRYNQKFLIEIGKLCHKYRIHLIYLSSLAVYGIPNNNLITSKSLRKPFNLYGRTKNSADIFFMNTSYKIHIFNLLPASIQNDSKNNFYNKLKALVREPFFKLIFFFFCPGGQFNFCSYENLSKEIINSIKYINGLNKKIKPNSIYYHEKIISKGIKFKEIYYDGNKYYPLFTLPAFKVKLIKFCFGFLTQRILLRLIFLFTATTYRNESL